MQQMIPLQFPSTLGMVFSGVIRQVGEGGVISSDFKQYDSWYLGNRTAVSCTKRKTSISQLREVEMLMEKMITIIRNRRPSMIRVQKEKSRRRYHTN